MHVIVFASQKGGSGKTTLCGQLAIQAERAGAGPVALIDSSLAEWWNARSESTPAFVKTRFTELMDDLAHLNNAGTELVFIDTPPAVTDAIRAVVTFADIVVIPTRPSPHDLRAIGATVDIVEDLGKPLVFAVNAATPRARITAESAIALSQHGTVAPVTVHQRTDFATSMIDGRSVMELNPDSRSSQEMVGLWNYISNRLGKVERRAEPQPYEGEERRYPVRDLPDSRQLFGNQSARPGFGRRPCSASRPASKRGERKG